MSQEFELEIEQLQKEIRILNKKLERSEIDRAKLEATNRSKESLLKRVICDLQDILKHFRKKEC